MNGNLSRNEAVRVEQVLVAPIRHTLKAARLLYTAPPWVLHGTIYIIFLVTFSALFYSFWATKSILVTAPLVLERESTTIEAIGGGMVYDILVKEGEFVTAGDTLAKIQEQTRISMSGEQTSLHSRLDELQKEYDKVDDEYVHGISQVELDLHNLTTSSGTQVKALKGKIEQINQQLETSRRSRVTAVRALETAKRAKEDKIKDRELAKKQLERTQILYESRDITVTEYERAVEKERKAGSAVLDAQTRISDAQSKINDSDARMAEIKISLQTTKGELSKLLDLSNKEKLEKELAQLQHRKQRDLKRLQEQIDGIKHKITESENLVAGVKFGENLTEYSSQFTGLITDVHANKGAMVNPGTAIATIVRDSAALEGRVLVENRDIGNLKRGQTVQIKYFAYPYQEWGIHNGKISYIATKPGGVAGQESKYIVKAALSSEEIKARGRKPRQLEIGLEGIAEIKTGEKRFIELVFTPVSRFFTQEEE